MAYICTKEKKCKECEHFLYDEENDRMACFAEIDEEVRTKLDAEITEFRKSYEDKTKKEIYNDWYKSYQSTIKKFAEENPDYVVTLVDCHI